MRVAQEQQPQSTDRHWGATQLPEKLIVINYCTFKARSAGAQARLLTRARTALMGAQGLFHPWRLAPHSWRRPIGRSLWSPSQSAFFARHGHPTRQHGSLYSAPRVGAAHLSAHTSPVLRPGLFSRRRTDDVCTPAERGALRWSHTDNRYLRRQPRGYQI